MEGGARLFGRTGTRASARTFSTAAESATPEWGVFAKGAILPSSAGDAPLCEPVLGEDSFEEIALPREGDAVPMDTLGHEGEEKRLAHYGAKRG